MNDSGRNKRIAWMELLQKVVGRKEGGAELGRSYSPPKPLPVVTIDPKRTDGRFHHVHADGTYIGRVLYRYVPDRFVFIDYIETERAHERKGYATSVLAQLAAKHNADIAPGKENSAGFWRALRAKTGLPFMLGVERDEAFVSGMRTYRSDEEPSEPILPRMRT